VSYLVYAGVAVFAVGYLLPLVVGGWAVYKTCRTESMPRFEPRDPFNMPAPVSQFVNRAMPRLRAEGFEVVGHYHFAGEVSNVETFVALLHNRAAGDSATVLCGHSTNPDAPPISNYIVGFSTEFADGTCVEVNNDSFPLAFANTGRGALYKFPGLQDLRRLYKAHRALVARHAPGRRGVLPSEGMEAVHLSTSWNRDFAGQVELGYYYMDEAEGVFRPTFKGAFLTTSKFLPPVKNILSALLKVRASATLKSLNLN
jgi:hypothetical protein